MSTALRTQPASDRNPRRGHGFASIGLVVALAASGALVIGDGPAETEPPDQSGRMSVAAAWPAAKLSTISDLPLQPLLFLDTAAVVGTAPSEDD